MLNIHSSARFSIFVVFLMSITSFLFSFLWLSYAFFSILVFLIIIFRHQRRVMPSISNVFVSSIDGVVMKIEKNIMNSNEIFSSEKFHCIFCKILQFNSRIIRMPLEGTIVHTTYTAGSNVLSSKFWKSFEKEEKECLTISVSSDICNYALSVTQSLLWPFSSIDFYQVEENDNLSKGQDFAVSKLGGIVKLYIPSNILIQVEVGQTLIAEETIVAGPIS